MISLAATSGARTNFDALGSKTGETDWIPAQSVNYEISGTLPAMPDSASAYRISSPDATLSMFDSLAKAFGITVTPEMLTKSADNYTAVNISGSTADGSASLSLTSDGSTTGWYYANSSAWGNMSWGCERSEPAAGSGDTPPDTGCKSETPEPTPNLPSEADARATAEKIFSDLGLNVGGSHFSFTSDSYTATVFAVETVADVDVPLQWTASFGENGVLLSASGVFASLSKEGEYSLISPEAGVKRLVSMVYAGRPAYMAEGSAIASDTSDVTILITGVEMSLMQVWESDGRSLLLPAFTYTNANGIVGQVIAVEDKYISVPSTSVTTEPEPPTSEPPSTTPGTGTLDDTIPTIAPLTSQEVRVLLGLSEEEARKVALGRGWGFRVAARDGVSFPLTADYSATRVNVSVVADEVTAVTVG